MSLLIREVSIEECYAEGEKGTKAERDLLPHTGTDDVDTKVV